MRVIVDRRPDFGYDFPERTRQLKQTHTEVQGRMSRTGKARMMRILPAVLAAVMMIAFLPDGTAEEAPAAVVKNQDNTWLGTSGISSPDIPADKDTPWSGSYVYFGSYNGSPVRFRVLAKDSTDYTSGKSLFLDSDATLFNGCFDHTSPYCNAWDVSDIRTILNGTFLDCFDVCEKAAISVSTGNGRRFYASGSAESVAFGTPVCVDDKVFLLDIADVLNEAYGYSSDSGWIYHEKGVWDWYPVGNHKKSGTFNCWWLRSAGFEGNSNHTGAVDNVGNFYGANVRYATIGVAPALNIGQDCILFATSVGAEANEFKLTLIDSDLTVTVPDGINIVVEGTSVSIPYEIGGPDADDAMRISVLILDREYSAGNTGSASIIYYSSLGSTLDGIGTFDLPAGCSPDGWESDYRVYILAEIIRGPYETDYASAPVAVSSP